MTDIPMTDAEVEAYRDAVAAGGLVITRDQVDQIKATVVKLERSEAIALFEFDLDAGETARDAGLALAQDAPRVQTWREKAVAWIESPNRCLDRWTADNLIAAVGLPDEGPNRNNAVGAVIRGAACRGIIAKAGEYRKTERPGGHARMVAVWKGIPR